MLNIFSYENFCTAALQRVRAILDDTRLFDFEKAAAIQSVLETVRPENAEKQPQLCEEYFDEAFADELF